MRAALWSAVVAGTCLVSAAPASAEVTVTFSDGYVSLEATDATLGQILAEWARVGQIRVVNAEGIAGAPLSLHLVRVPEAQALAILLRSVSGYMAAPRPAPVPNASRFDRIFVMPTSTLSPQTQAPSQSAQAFQPPMPTGVEDVEVEDVEVEDDRPQPEEPVEAVGAPEPRDRVVRQDPLPVSSAPVRGTALPGVVSPQDIPQIPPGMVPAQPAVSSTPRILAGSPQPNTPNRPR